MTRNMSDQEYQRFHQSRQVSFANKARPSKFRDWLSQQTRDSGLPSDLKINDFAMEVLQYLAFETVAELVDMCLLVKQDAGKMASDPVHNLTRLHKPLPPTGIVNRTRSGIEDTTLKRKRQQVRPLTLSLIHHSILNHSAITPISLRTYTHTHTYHVLLCLPALLYLPIACTHVSFHSFFSRAID